MTGRRRALVLLGHGSHLNPDSSAPVYDHAATIRATGLFDQVLEAFWKEEPSLRDAIDLVECEDVYIVPIFLAEGYFTRQVLPRELGLTGAVTHRDGRSIHYCPPVGTHPKMAEMILDRARSVGELSAEARRRAALVIIGHGTERSDTSGGTVYRLVEALRRGDEFGSVTCGFLDEEPRIANVLAAIHAPAVVMVPFFVAEGWHTADTIPEELGLTGARTTAGSATVWYAPPVGTLPGVAGVVLALAREAGAFDERPPAEPATLPIHTARRAFFDSLRKGSTTSENTLLQLAIRRLNGETFELRHTDDRELPEARLELLSDSAQLLGLARRDASGAYRPLRTTGDLRRGWIVRNLDEDALWEALSLIYPAAVLHWHLERIGALTIVDFRDWAARQSGAYRAVRDLDGEPLRAVIDSCCGSCLKRRLWSPDSALPVVSPSSPAPHGPPSVPCREPCTLFGTYAREAVDNHATVLSST